MLGIPPPLLVNRNEIAPGISDYVYDDPKLLRQARRRLAKCWHSDKARLHRGLPTRDLESLSGGGGIFDDSFNRALELARKCRGHYPASDRQRLSLHTSKLSLGSPGLTFLDEAAKQDTVLSQQLANPRLKYGFKSAEGCPPCTPEFLFQQLLEAALTPPWSLPAQPTTWRHLPETCSPCTWASISQSYTHFFGDWDVNWRTLTLNLTSLEQASRDGRLPPPGRTHEFWQRQLDLGPTHTRTRSFKTYYSVRLTLQLSTVYYSYLGPQNLPHSPASARRPGRHRHWLSPGIRSVYGMIGQVRAGHSVLANELRLLQL